MSRTAQGSGAKIPQLNSQGFPPADRIIAYLIRRVDQICQGRVAEALSGTNISLLQLAVLAHIDDEPEIDQSRLAEKASIDRTNTGRLVDELERMGLVDRRVNGSDRRARVLRLTPRGAQLRHRLRPLAHKAQDILLGSLSSKERKVLIDLLVRVVKANGAYIRPGAGRRRILSKVRTTEREDGGSLNERVSDDDISPRSRGPSGRASTDRAR